MVLPSSTQTRGSSKQPCCPLWPALLQASPGRRCLLSLVLQLAMLTLAWAIRTSDVGSASWPALACLTAACVATSILPDCCWGGSTAASSTPAAKLKPTSKGDEAEANGLPGTAVGGDSASTAGDGGQWQPPHDSNGSSPDASRAFASCSASDASPGLSCPDGLLLGAGSGDVAGDVDPQQQLWSQSLEEEPALCGGELPLPATCGGAAAVESAPATASQAHSCASAAPAQGKHDSEGNNTGTAELFSAPCLLASPPAPFSTAVAQGAQSFGHSAAAAPAEGLPSLRIGQFLSRALSDVNSGSISSCSSWPAASHHGSGHAGDEARSAVLDSCSSAAEPAADDGGEAAGRPDALPQPSVLFPSTPPEWKTRQPAASSPIPTSSSQHATPYPADAALRAANKLMLQNCSGPQQLAVAVPKATDTGSGLPVLRLPVGTTCVTGAAPAARSRVVLRRPSDVISSLFGSRAALGAASAAAGPAAPGAALKPALATYKQVSRAKLLSLKVCGFWGSISAHSARDG